MPKITFIGAGSTIFLRHLLGDAVLMPSLSNAEIALMDIDEQRLAESELVARRVVETLKAGASVTATTSRREALDRKSRWSGACLQSAQPEQAPAHDE